MEEIKTLNLYQKLAAIRDIADVAVRSKKGFGYTYADQAEILSKVKAGMKKYGVLLLPAMVPGTADVSQVVAHNTKVDKAGNVYEQVITEMLFSSQVVFTWVNCENPDDKIEAPWFITGAMSDPGQALGAAGTYGMRQFLTSYFQIPQVDEQDVDAYRSKQKEAEAAEELETANQIISQLDSRLKMYLSDNPDNRDKVVAVVKKYVKSGDYTKIKEPMLAGKLLKEFIDTFTPEEHEKKEE